MKEEKCARRTILLGFSSSGIQAVEYLGDSPLFFLTWVSEKLRPAMLAQQAAILRVFFVNLKKDHATRLLIDHRLVSYSIK